LYRPRSRGGIIAAIATWTRAWMPPMPRPWNARAAISCPALCEKPAIGPRIVGAYNYGVSFSLRKFSHWEMDHRLATLAA